MIGKIIVICGPMYAGKTSYLQNQINKYKYSHSVSILKPQIDDRYSEDEIVTHLSSSMKATCINSAQDILDHYYKKPTDVIAIDEAQFLKGDPKKFIKILRTLKRKGVIILINGLDMDFKGNPFGIMPYLGIIADEIVKLKPICQYPGCKNEAEMTYLHKPNSIQYTENGSPILLGSTEKYEARCLEHWSKPEKI